MHRDGTNNLRVTSNPDFRFERGRANLLILSDAFIHEGSDARNQVRTIYTQGLKSKTGSFQLCFNGFLKVDF